MSLWVAIFQGLVQDTKLNEKRSYEHMSENPSFCIYLSKQNYNFGYGLNIMFRYTIGNILLVPFYHCTKTKT